MSTQKCKRCRELSKRISATRKSMLTVIDYCENMKHEALGTRNALSLARSVLKKLSGGRVKK